MAALYVHALTDVPLEAWADGNRTIESVPVEGIFAICERRANSPPVNEDELRRQHAIVLRIAESVPAALPARFGSLVERAELATILRDRRDVVRTALDRVRGHVQMTVRIAVQESDSAAGRPAQSGRAYLQARFRQASPELPPRTRTALAGVDRWVVDQRRTRRAAGTVTVYHLVRREHVQKYKIALARADVAGMRVTGPWPAFAFVPDLWT